MKKILCLLIACLTALSCFAACGKANRQDGTEMARLLLANERLDAGLLKNEGDIFENGVQVMNTLAERAIENLGVSYAADSTLSVTRLASSGKIQSAYGGYVEFDGQNYIWSEFKENNNSYDYFKNMTDAIVVTANIAAEMIDSVKKNVRIVDKWVDMKDKCYYLHVDENSELLCQLDPNGYLDLCRRYKNEDGKDVYELYLKQDHLSNRMTYIPGERYELSMMDENDRTQNTFFVAENTKGYWETYTVNEASEHYNVSYFIMKNDICYDAFYNPVSGEIPLLKVMSADKATDIFNIDAGSVVIKLSGFDGVKNVVASSDIVDISTEDNVVQAYNAGDKIRVNMSNGKTLCVGDTFVDGKVTLESINATYSYGGYCYTGEIYAHIESEDREEQMSILRAFINETGFKCRRDLDTVISSISRAYVELDGIVKYYRWNGISVIDHEGIGAAINAEKLRFDSMLDLYTEVKDAPALDYFDSLFTELNVKFAPITEKNVSAVKLDGIDVSVGSVSLTIEDTTLYVKDEPYKVGFAMVRKDGTRGLVHFELDNQSTVSYADEDKFTVDVSNVSFELPVLSSGDYTLVAYISTSDGIRSSEYIIIPFESVSEGAVDAGQVRISATRDASGALTVSYNELENFTIQLFSEEKLDHTAFKKLLACEVFKYGTPVDDVIEMKSAESYVALEGTESEIADGVYRMRYSVQNGDIAKEGYIYAEYALVENVEES